MVRPAEPDEFGGGFGFNPQNTDNHYAQASTDPTIARRALAEFDAAVETLDRHDIDITVVQDTPEPSTPDSIFPNNWASYHPDGTLILYPMRAANRRDETEKPEVLSAINKRFAVHRTIDLRPAATEGKFLEGTGSIIFDHEHSTAYAGLSGRTNKELFEHVCRLIDYEPISFSATDAEGNDIYHTNVMMNLGDEYAVLCLEAIRNEQESSRLLKSIVRHRRKIIPITHEQVGAFAGNMLQVYSRRGNPYTLLSQTALHALSVYEQRYIQETSKLLPVDIETIQKVGGGSIRCMVAEVHLPPITHRG